MKAWLPHRAEPIAEADGHAVEAPQQLARGATTGHGRIEQASAVKVRGQAPCMSPGGGVMDIGGIQDLSAPGVFQAQQTGTREVGIVGFDGRFDVGPFDSSVWSLGQGLRLNAAQNGRTATFPSIGVGHLADDVFIAPVAVRHERTQIALRAAGHEQGRLKSQVRRDALLQPVDGGIVPEHIVAHFRAQHGLAHGRGRAGDRVASQVDHGRRW